MPYGPGARYCSALLAQGISTVGVEEMNQFHDVLHHTYVPLYRSLVMLEYLQTQRILSSFRQLRAARCAAEYVLTQINAIVRYGRENQLLAEQDTFDAETYQQLKENLEQEALTDRTETWMKFLEPYPSIKLICGGKHVDKAIEIAIRQEKSHVVLAKSQ
ncbi:hypothetical protein HY490_04060 [Candidatus Woesearchaeota archaeon]|nr:hypothetical protein [Candidatus Woesearchaeota archaeon]